MQPSAASEIQGGGRMITASRAGVELKPCRSRDLQAKKRSRQDLSPEVLAGGCSWGSTLHPAP